MVYTGKPSRGCQRCKDRRIKCDEAKPHCSNCSRKSLECPGYPDEFDLLFRDETANQVRRASRTSPTQGVVRSRAQRASSSRDPARRQEDRRRRSTSTESEAEDAVIEQYEGLDLVRRAVSQSHGPSLTPNLSPSSVNEARAFFFRNFVMLPRESESIRGYLEHLVPLYNQASSTSVLHAATHAVALCTLGAYPNRSHMLQEARRTYGETLNRVNMAINDPVQSKSDELLLSIMMCALYEEGMRTVDEMKSDLAPVGTNTSTTQRVLPWVSHVKGAVTLVKHRGEEQFRNKQSFDMFRAVRAMMLLSCMQRQTPVEDLPIPPGWIGLRDSQENAANRLTIISLHIPRIQGQANILLGGERTPQKEHEVQQLIETAKSIEVNLVSWMRTLPVGWEYRTKYIVASMSDNIFEAPEWLGPQHTYKDVFIANLINENRIHRIVVQGIIHNCCSWLHQGSPRFEEAPEAREATVITCRMADEICASVPFHAQVDPRPDQELTEEDETAARAIGAYMLTWPLLVCAKNKLVPERQRQWIQGRLLTLGRVFGLNPAQLSQVTSERFVVSSIGIP